MESARTIYNDSFDGVIEPTSLSDEYVKCDFRFFQSNGVAEFSGVFRDCDFFSADLEGCLLTGEYINCDFTGVNFTNCKFRAPKFQSCNLSAATFTRVSGLFTAQISPGCTLEEFVGATAKVCEKTSNFLLMQVGANDQNEGKVTGTYRKTAQGALFPRPKNKNKKESEPKVLVLDMATDSWADEWREDTKPLIITGVDEDDEDPYLAMYGPAAGYNMHANWHAYNNKKPVDRSAVLFTSDEEELDGC